VCREANLVARGLDEIWGRLRNSSRSIVPELSYSSLISLLIPILSFVARGIPCPAS